ncbi:MAG: site-specific integrase [Actinomycetota bacterium]
MRGHVRKRGTSWSIVFDAGRDPDTGRRRQRWQGGFRTKREAEAELNRQLHQVEQGADAFPSNITLADFAVRWLEHQESRLRPLTHDRYKRLMEREILPLLGSVRLSKLRPAHVQQLLDRMTKKGAAPRTVLQARAVLGSAVSTAVAWGLITVNPVRSVRPPRVERARLDIPTGEQLRQLMTAARGTIWEAPIVLAATTGMRRSEVLGLRWADVDLRRGRVRVTRTLQRSPDRTLQFFDPKTTRARREIVLPNFVPPILLEHGKAQAERKLLAGAEWQDFDLVCERGDGRPMDPDSFGHAFKRLAAEAGISPKTRLHDIRHGVATVLLEQQVHPAIASAVLGHASESFTMATYQHVTPRMTEAAARSLEAVLTPVEGPAGHTAP